MYSTTQWIFFNSDDHHLGTRARRGSFLAAGRAIRHFVPTGQRACTMGIFPEKKATSGLCHLS